MKALPVPSAPGFDVDFDGWTAEYPWVRALRGCVQDSVHHAEGDVWVHTRMVCEALASSREWRGLPEAARRRVFLSALLHDVGKPDCTRVEEGRVTSRGHSERGAVIARRILWEHGVPLAEREAICSAIRFHQAPFFLVDRPDSERSLFEISLGTVCDELARVTWADATGRHCSDQSKLLERIELFRAYAEEKQCLTGPRAFPSAHARFAYFRTAGRDPSYAPHEQFRCEVVLMSGLPGAGKSTWVAKQLPDWPVVSLDAIRDELDVDPSEKQGPVVGAARERARELLRAGTSFVWNATNISRSVRSQCIDLFAGYGAKVRIVYVEASPERLFEQNRNREARVPEKVIQRLLDKWTVPALTEAHEVDYAATPSP